MGLHLALDLGWSGVRVRDFHRAMGRPDASWPRLPRPASTGEVTVADVVAAGAQIDSAEGHASAVDSWARSVWAAWSGEHEPVRTLARRLGA